MHFFQKQLEVAVQGYLNSLNTNSTSDLTFQQTRKEFEGDLTLVVFPITKVTRLSPEATGTAIGEYLVQHCPLVEKFNVVKGFLNLSIKDEYWLSYFKTEVTKENFGLKPADSSGKTVMVEYSSPNTNKPLHLGHVRNNLLGFSVAAILKANGHKVIKTNIVNDRGIHICKSMLAWEKFGNGETPSSSGMKGDHLVGKYYVAFDRAYKKEIEVLVTSGMPKEEAEKKAPLMLEAQQMLLKWEQGDKQVVELWKMMNSWVYEGFAVSYKKLGVDFDHIYYESETYLLGKEIVEEGLQKGVFFKKENGSVWIDLSSDGLDEKLVLRGDGTSVYITQDLGTAQQRFDKYKMDSLVYVVGNEQDYHFKVLRLIMAKIGRPWAEGLYHLSYGMVELPSGKMKSREGTVVDADDLVDGMVSTACDMTRELGKLDGLSEQDAQELYETIGMGALKYFILRVDPKKTILFNPEESIDFNGNTGPFIQYTHARICSVLRKAEVAGLSFADAKGSGQLEKKERELMIKLSEWPDVLAQAGQEYSPALVAAHVYDLAKLYNQFYHDHSILNESIEEKKLFRLQLSEVSSKQIASALSLLGVRAPQQM